MGQNQPHGNGTAMLNETMYAYGAASSKIREIFAYGCERKAQIGPENVFDFSLGNPSIPAPDAVRASIERSLAELSPEELHGYTPAPGLPAARAAVAASLNRRFDTAYEASDVFMTVGAPPPSPARCMPSPTPVTRSSWCPRISPSTRCGSSRAVARVWRHRRSPTRSSSRWVASCVPSPRARRPSS